MIATVALGLGLLALLVVLAVPLDMALAVRRRTSLEGDITLRWLFGLVQIPLLPSRSGKKRKPAKPRRGKKRAARPHFAHRGLTILRNAALRRRVLVFASSILHSFRMREMALRLRLGLDDPADTGMLWALAGPFIAALETHPAANVDLELDFSDARFDADAQGTVRVVPLQVAYVTLLFILSPAVLWAAGVLLFGDRR